VLDRLHLPAADSPMRRVVELVNPMSEAQSILRPTIVGSLLDAARHNLARGATDLGLFESGTVYRAGEGDLADEHHALGALLTGRLGDGGWRGGAPQADFFAAKGVLAAVLDALRLDWTVEAAEWPFLHPGRSAAVLAGETRLGFVGELHPLVAREWEIDQPVAVFAVNLDAIAPLVPETTGYVDLISFPALRQDIAVVVGDDVPAARVVEVVRAAGGKLLAGAEVFDVFRGEDLNPARPGRISLALHLEFRAGDRTLSDEDVAPVREKIVARLLDELGGELRG
jgi:phenylalanyl-tRNA synthetase beta chain